MGYQLTSLSQFVAARAGIDALELGTGANAVEDRVGALKASAAGFTALRETGVTPAAESGWGR